MPPPLTRPFVSTGPYPARAGNEVQPWIDGEPAFRRICQAIDTANTTVWATIAFMWPSFQMPDGRGSALDVLESAARRGVDVRLVFWRPDDETAAHRVNAFWGSPEHLAALARFGSNLKVRWDRAHPGYCQHQKTWLIDAGRDDATSFVGGINLNPHSVVTPGHAGDGHNHDAYIELRGPAVADIHHNFCQRWNEATERTLDGGRWGIGSDGDLPFPDRKPPQCGPVEVQVQRTIHAGQFGEAPAAPGGAPYDFSAGEKANLDQYLAAIRAAHGAIYLENQHLEASAIAAALEEALGRGVDVVALVPMARVSSAEAVPPRIARLASAAPRAGYGAFTLCGIAGLGEDGERKPVHVHSKLMLVDDDWGTLGSCNLHHYSLFGNAELNLAFRDSAAVRGLRVELFREHLDADTAGLNLVEALQEFRRVATGNRDRHGRGDTRWQGLAITLGT